MTTHKYVNPESGIDTNDGSELTPYKTLAKADTVAVADTTIHLRGGVYPEHFEPSKDGGSSTPITWIAYTGETPVLAGDPNTEIIMDVSQASYNIFDGLTFRWGYTSGVSGNKRFPLVRFIGTNAANNTIRNCIIERQGYDNMAALFTSGWAEWGIIVDGAVNTSILSNLVRGVKFGVHIKNADQNTLVQDNNIGPCVGSGIVMGPSLSTMRDCLIYRNRIHGSYEEDGIQFHEANSSETDTSNWGTTIYFNDIFDCGENGIDLKGARYIVVDSNFFWELYGSGAGPTNGWNRNVLGSITRGARSSTQDNIVRNNVFFNASSGIRIRGANYHIYNNTALWNNFDYLGPDSAYTNVNTPPFKGVMHQDGSGNAYVKNNLTWGHKAADIIYRVSSPGGMTIESDYNIAQTFADWVVGTGWTAYTLAAWKTLLDGTGWPGGDDNSLSPSAFSDLAFENVPQKPVGDRTQFDFRIKNTSVAYHAGGWLTKADGAGTGSTQLKMLNPGYFREDTTLKQGDTIFIAGQTRRITAINRTTRICTLSATATWANNDPIYYGSSSTPNIGATPLDGSGSPGGGDPGGGDPSGTGAVAVTLVAAQTAGGTQDIPITGLANAPKAVEILCGYGTVDGTAADHAILSVGAMTTTGQWAFAVRVRHDQNPTETRRRSVNDGCLVLINESTNAVLAKAAYSSFSASQVSITWLTTPPAGYMILVRAYDCEQADARISDAINGTVDLSISVPVGFEANVVRSASYNEDVPDNFNNARFAYGTATYNSGVLTQNCFSWFDNNAQGAGAPAALVQTGRVCAQISTAGAANWTLEVTSLNSSGYNLTTRDGTPSDTEKVGLLTMRFGTGVWSGIIDIPTAAGTSPYTTGFRPSYVDMLATHLTATNTGDSGHNAGAFGFGSTNGTDKASTSVADEDASTPSNSQSLATSSKVVNVPLDDGSAGVVADSVAFTTNGFEAVWSAVPGTVRKAIAFAIQSIAVVTAEFSGTPRSGSIPFDVVFTDLSTEQNTTITDWLWDFGDGDTSTDQSPTHTYDAAGIYEVSLTVTDGTVSDTETKAAYVVAEAVVDIGAVGTTLTGTAIMPGQIVDPGQGAVLIPDLPAATGLGAALLEES